MSWKKFLLLLLPFLLLVVACDRIVNDPKGDEKERLRAWLIVNNITTEPTSSGLYYINKQEGNEKSPSDSNYLVFSYVKRNLDDYVYETTYKDIAELYDIYSVRTHYVPAYTQYIKRQFLPKGLAEGLSLMGEGGKARLIIPSSIGSVGTYTTLIYDIELKKVVEDPIAYENDSIARYLSSHLGYTSIADSIYFKDSIVGTGTSTVTNDSTVTVKYVGKYLDGFVFDTNIKKIGAENGITVSKDTLLKFKVGSADYIKGYGIALKHMKKGGIAKVIIPSKSGYGATGKSPIPSYTPIYFEITLVDINP